MASPTLRDPNFSRTVVLLCEYSTEGAMGLVLNRPTDVPLSQAIDQFEAHATQPVFTGGPVQRGIVLVLHQDTSISGSRTVCDGVALGGDETELLDLLRTEGAKRARVFSGYAGWGAGQLEDELEVRSWIMCPASARVVFEVDSVKMWEEALRILGPKYAYLARVPIDPSVN